MKRKVFIILIIVLVVLSTGCKKKLEEKIGEKFLEEVTGGAVDISKGGTTIKTEEGETTVGENLKWPTDKMGDLPKLKANIISISEDTNGKIMTIVFNDMKEKDIDEYVEEVKDLGYTPASEGLDSLGYFFNGYDNTGKMIAIFYAEETSTGTLSYSTESNLPPSDTESISPIPGGSFTGDPVDSVDMTDIAPWPKDFIKTIPELEGKITQLSSSDTNSKYIYIEYVNKQDALDYIEKLKAAGFTDSPSESIAEEYLDYEAGHENGDYITFSWSSESASMNLIKGE